MSRHRLYIQNTLVEHTTLELERASAHYLATVLRARVGDDVVLFDNSGLEFHAKVHVITRKNVTLIVAGSHQPKTESALSVVLLQSVIRSERMDFCVQKATELGVSCIAPVFTERSVVKIPKDRLEKRQSHWHKIAVSACEQSGRVRVPEILAPNQLERAVQRLVDRSIPLFVLDPWADAIPLHRASLEGDRVAVCVGPEGGFSESELSLLNTAGATAVTCGPRVLRSETAGIVAVAACQMNWGDWNMDSDT